jgi:putative transposase
METEMATKTLRVKVRSGMGWLNAAAREVNMVWNWANETSSAAATRTDTKRKWLSGYDLDGLSAGATHEFERIASHTIKEVCHQYAVKRRKVRRTRLRWRASGGPRRALGWVPFKRDSVRFKDGAVVFAGRRFRVFDSYGLDKYDLRAGSFAQNALGDWFFNVMVHVPVQASDLSAKAVGLDLGLSATATCSDGRVLNAGGFYRGIEQKLAMAQRRGHKRQAKRLSLRAANRRQNALHKFSTLLVREHGAIYIGDVSSTKLVKTRMAKSVLDAGWGILKQQLIFKGHRAGRIVEVVDESFTTRTCSNCGQHTGPKGLGQLVVREWSCGHCGAAHNRDVNAARNILARGNARPLAGTPS